MWYKPLILLTQSELKLNFTKDSRLRAMQGAIGRPANGASAT
jgi:hypothetical protein